MRVFWGLIAVLVLVAGVVLGAQWYRQSKATVAAEEAARLAAAARPAEPPPAPVAEPPKPQPKPEPAPAPPPQPDLEQIAKEQERALREAHPSLPITVTPAEPTPTPATTPAALTPSAAPKTNQPEAPKPEPEAEKPARVALPGELPKTLGTYAVSPATFEIKDGKLVVDGKYSVRGVGTAEDPYQIPWELLTSVEKDFDPHEGKKAIPGRVAFLHGKYASLAGYVSFPLMVKEPRECLAMLNQWDGCCIGVPPTPFDAIEVQLGKAIRGNDRFATAGAVKGVLEIKPYVVGDWLVGLYVMDSGELKVSDWGAAGGF